MGRGATFLRKDKQGRKVYLIENQAFSMNDIKAPEGPVPNDGKISIQSFLGQKEKNKKIQVWEIPGMLHHIKAILGSDYGFEANIVSALESYYGSHNKAKYEKTFLK